ncbi:hypothetical protein NCGM1900_0116 [Pseudomonas aeruginosa]|nr:hypothetical protein NCGM1900_0116 [Pseudomonas aeruginosa]
MTPWSRPSMNWPAPPTATARITCGRRSRSTWKGSSGRSLPSMKAWPMPMPVACWNTPRSRSAGGCNEPEVDPQGGRRPGRHLRPLRRADRPGKSPESRPGHRRAGETAAAGSQPGGRAAQRGARRTHPDPGALAVQRPFSGKRQGNPDFAHRQGRNYPLKVVTRLQDVSKRIFTLTCT